MLKIRLSRHGKKKQPIYRIVVAEHTMPVKGKFIEIVGFYNPRTKEIGLKKEKIETWMKNGAKPSDTVAMLLRREKIKLSEEFQKPKKYVKAKKTKEGGEQAKPSAQDKEKTAGKNIKADEEKKPESASEKPEEEKLEKKVPADQPEKPKENKQDKQEEKSGK